MSIVYQTNKQTGITYVYESQAYWDKEKQQSRARRKLIGKLDPETGEIVPTRSYNKHVPKEKGPAKQGPVPITRIQRRFYGATHLFDQIGVITGVQEDLKACFQDTYKQILSVAYYLILEDSNPLSRFSRWHRLHVHPYGDDLPSQRSSELFQSMKEEQRMAFFKKQGKRRIEKEYWA
ncbi:MAG: transposase, partial [Clostridia bacterium]|nr:transposase [Clostridia bacterium]